MAETAIVVCTCNHGAQDKLYGNARRLANVCKVKKSADVVIRTYRCTVCGKEHNTGKLNKK